MLSYYLPMYVPTFNDREHKHYYYSVYKYVCKPQKILFI